MRVGDKVRVSVLWGFGYRPVERTGTILDIYTNGLCKVKIELEHGGHRIVRGYLSDCKAM